MTIKASVIPIINRIENKIDLLVDNEKVKQDKQFNKSIYEQTLLGVYFEIIKLTKILENDKPKYTKEPIKASSE
jgi:hypothetical protein